MDYYQIFFDELILTIYSTSTVEYKEKKYTFPNLGSCDTLQSMIGSKVRNIELKDGEFIKLFTDRGHVLEVALIHPLKLDAVTFSSMNSGDPFEAW